MEKSGSDPELTICKIAVLPIKLYPLKISKEGLEPSRPKPTKLKFVVFSNFTIWTYYSKVEVTRTLDSAVMSSVLYQLSYNLLY